MLLLIVYGDSNAVVLEFMLLLFVNFYGILGWLHWLGDDIGALKLNMLLCLSCNIFPDKIHLCAFYSRGETRQRESNVASLHLLSSR